MQRFSRNERAKGREHNQASVLMNASLGLLLTLDVKVVNRRGSRLQRDSTKKGDRGGRCGVSTTSLSVRLHLCVSLIFWGL